MPNIKCKICNSEFYARPSYIKNGHGIYCSNECHYEDVKRSRIRHKCFTCGIEVYRTKAKTKNSKSQKFFCSKSCQTRWRNTVFVGKKHNGWKGGLALNYRNILTKSGELGTCKLCGLRDKRVLAVHHVDENRFNHDVKNLAWLCHNCHRLVHRDKVEKQRFIKSL
jgi:hypothetical protein